jgi:hypothetical protein
MASAGMLVSQAVKVVILAAAMKPPPEMRKICRLFMAFFLKVQRGEYDCLTSLVITQLHKLDGQPFTYE